MISDGFLMCHVSAPISISRRPKARRRLGCLLVQQKGLVLKMMDAIEAAGASRASHIGALLPNG